MKKIEKIDLLSEQDLIYSTLAVERGKIIGFAVIQIAIIDEQRHQIARYDCAHGYAHKDCLYEKRLRKEILPMRPLNELFKTAKEEIRVKWQNWKGEYIRNKRNDLDRNTNRRHS